MKNEIITCDCCGKVIAGGTWEDAPGSVVFQFGAPEQKHVTVTLGEVCYACRQGIKAGIPVLLESVRGKGATP